MTDQELEVVLGFYERTSAAVRELQLWRGTCGPLLEKLVGEFRGGAAGNEPYTEMRDLVELGLLQRAKYDPAVHSDPKEFGVEEGDDHYVLTPATAALLGEKL